VQQQLVDVLSRTRAPLSKVIRCLPSGYRPAGNAHLGILDRQTCRRRCRGRRGTSAHAERLPRRRAGEMTSSACAPGPLWPTARRGPTARHRPHIRLPAGHSGRRRRRCGQESVDVAGAKDLKPTSSRPLQETRASAAAGGLNNTGNRVYGRARLRPASFWNPGRAYSRCTPPRFGITAGRASRSEVCQPGCHSALPCTGVSMFHVTKLARQRVAAARCAAGLPLRGAVH